MSFDESDLEKYKKALESFNAASIHIVPSIKAFENVYESMVDVQNKKFSANLLKLIDSYRERFSDISALAVQLQSALLNIELSDEARAFIDEAKASGKLSEDEFEKKYKEEISVCKKLGLNGWVVSAHMTPRKIQEWYRAIVEEENSERIVQFFYEDDCRVIKNIISYLEKIYVNPSNKNYFLRGIKSFNNEDYMTSAMYLVALIDVRINKLVEFPEKIRSYSQKFSDTGFVDVKQAQFEKSDDFFTKRYYFLDVYPSLIAFLNRLFVDGDYQFKNEIEPPYINRNWILHGRSSREIERYECVQLLNALEMIERILGNTKNVNDDNN